MGVYRTRTYIAGDWTGDSDLIEAIRYWNEGDKWALSFSDAHKLTQSSDDSLPCSVKSSLKKRLDASKAFVLIVGEHTKNLTKGSCYNCNSYYNSQHRCVKGWSTSSKSFIEYECDVAARDGLGILVIYNSTRVDRDKCPQALRWDGQHIPGVYRGSDGELHWNYAEIRDAIEIF